MVFCMTNGTNCRPWYQTEADTLTRTSTTYRVSKPLVFRPTTGVVLSATGSSPFYYVHMTKSYQPLNRRILAQNERPYTGWMTWECDQATKLLCVCVLCVMVALEQ